MNADCEALLNECDHLSDAVFLNCFDRRVPPTSPVPWGSLYWARNVRTGFWVKVPRSALTSGGFTDRTAPEVSPDNFARKIAVTRVEILWSELGTLEGKIAGSLSSMDSILSSAYFTETRGREESRGYFKTGFRVTWEDGDTWEGRIDLTGSRFHGTSCLSIADHIRNYALTGSGRKVPPRYTRESWEAYLDAVKMDRADMAKRLDNYDLGDGVEAHVARAEESFRRAGASQTRDH